MRLLFLNLPSGRPVIRRYKCSYDASFFLFPPWELLSMATVARGAGADVEVFDAIAARSTVRDVVRRIVERPVDGVVTVTGVEIIDTDLETIRRIKNGIGDTPIIVTGYMPSWFPGDALKRSSADAVVRFEPERTIEELV